MSPDGERREPFFSDWAGERIAKILRIANGPAADAAVGKLFVFVLQMIMLFGVIVFIGMIFDDITPTPSDPCSFWHSPIGGKNC